MAIGFMKKIYEAWDDEENCCMPFAAAEGILEDRLRGRISANAKLLFRVEADTWEEALAVRNIKMGWSPYIPEGKPQSCPRGCGSIFYPEGSGECPNCGKIC